jgi:hypothetical protein
MVVMMITVVSMGFIAKSDTEMLTGENMVRRVETDYAAQAGLAYARSYWLQFYDPFYKDIHLNSGFTTGPMGNIVKPGGNAQFEVTISDGDFSISDSTSDPNSFTYKVRCEGYRFDDGVRSAQTILEAKLHFKPVYDGLSVYDPVNSKAFFKSIKKN